MDLILLIIYILIFISFVVTYIKCWKKKAIWYRLLLFESFAMLISYIIMRYYDTLPGFGMMPGLSYFGEILFSLGAFYLYGFTLIITFITYVIRSRKE